MLYLVQAIGHVGYDCNAGFVVACGTSEEARSICAAAASDEGSGLWLDPKASMVRNIGEAIPGDGPGILLTDFRAG